MEQLNAPNRSRKSSALRRKAASEKASVIVEFAMTAPLLLTIIIGIIGTGNIMSQLPWSAHTAYQLAASLSENPTSIGAIAMDHRYRQLELERTSMFANLGLQFHPEELFTNSFYGTLNGVEVVGIRINATINPLFNFRLPNALSMEFTAPHLASAISVDSITGFASPADAYDCCGIRCGDPGSNCGSPTACYDSGNGSWIGACPAPL